MIRHAPKILQISTWTFGGFIVLLLINTLCGRTLDSFILLFFYGAPWSYLLSDWFLPQFDEKTDPLFPAPFLISFFCSLLNLGLLYSLYLALRPLAANPKLKQGEDIMAKIFIGILYVILAIAWLFGVFALIGVAHATFQI